MNLKTLLSPESVALIGASNREGSLGYDMVKMIRRGEYPGEIYPINPVAINDDTIMALDALIICK